MNCELLTAFFPDCLPRLHGRKVIPQYLVVWALYSPKILLAICLAAAPNEPRDVPGNRSGTIRPVAEIIAMTPLSEERAVGCAINITVVCQRSSKARVHRASCPAPGS